MECYCTHSLKLWHSDWVRRRFEGSALLVAVVYLTETEVLAELNFELLLDGVEAGDGRARPACNRKHPVSFSNTHNFQTLVTHLSSVQCFTCRKYICNIAWRSGYCSMTSRSILLITFLHPFSSFNLMSRSSKVSSVVFLVDRISLVSLEDWSERNSGKLIEGVGWLAQIDVLLQSLSLRKRKSKWHIGLLVCNLWGFFLSNSFTLFCNPV